MMRVAPHLIFALLIAGVGQALAQDPGTVEDKVLPPLEHPDAPSTPAKELFGRKTKPDVDPARSIGFYAHGCLAGAVALPVDGATWQVMRLSRNRNWGHPKLVEFLERLAQNAKKVGWNGLLVGDMSQPRGGPMLTGHSSHQVGLDADIWLTPMPDRTLSREERELMSATMVVSGRSARCRSKGLDPRSHRTDPRRGRGSGRRAHFRQCRDQEGAVPGGRIGSCLARQGAAVARARLSFPRPHLLSARQSAVRAAAAAGIGRGLRSRARLLVLPRRPASAADANRRSRGRE